VSSSESTDSNRIQARRTKLPSIDSAVERDAGIWRETVPGRLGSCAALTDPVGIERIAKVSLIETSTRRTSPPQILEPVRRQLGIAHRVLDVAMPKIRLRGAGIVAGISKGEAAGVAQHVRVRLEVEAGFRAGSARPSWQSQPSRKASPAR
jgi:hypothetical protein